jgi:hypothetical protein
MSFFTIRAAEPHELDEARDEIVDEILGRFVITEADDDRTIAQKVLYALDRARYDVVPRQLGPVQR